MSVAGWLLPLLLVGATAPCLWDSDTLDTELRGLPDAFDLVVGRWHRHGDAYYQQRIARLGGKAELTMAEFDDLAVARERLGDHDAAIAVMQRKAAALAKAPDAEHQYRYLANLGTFQAHAGRYEEALTALRAAVALNPKAHFGREVFQIEAIEYVAAAKTKPELWARSFLQHAGYPGIYDIRRAFKRKEDEAAASEVDCKVDWGDARLDAHGAYEAIGGMLRFGGQDAAELYRSLGEVFLEMQHLNLAWWSFRRAIERGHPASGQLRDVLRHIEDHWRKAADFAATANAIPDEALYRSVRENSDRWLGTFQQLEQAAIARGDDVTTDAVLQSLVGEADRRVPRVSMPTAWSRQQKGIGAAVFAVCALIVLYLKGLRTRLRAQA